MIEQSIIETDDEMMLFVDFGPGLDHVGYSYTDDPEMLHDGGVDYDHLNDTLANGFSGGAWFVGMSLVVHLVHPNGRYDHKVIGLFTERMAATHLVNDLILDTHGYSLTPGGWRATNADSPVWHMASTFRTFVVHQG